jgi:hypothetical protein
VIYDKSFDLYLAVYVTSSGIKVRASSDLIHWSGPIGAPYKEAGRALFYPTLLGETGDPTIAGPAPRIYFSSFPTGSFPDWKTSVFDSVQLTLSRPVGQTNSITQTSTEASVKSTTPSVMQQTNSVNETLLGLLLAVLGLIVAGYVVLKRKKAKEKPV